MILRFLCALFAALIGLAPATAAELPSGCDSCRIVVHSLDQPIKLKGQWLFTRDDSPQNKEPGADLSAWKLVSAPGPWKAAYKDGKVFNVGWYRGNFEFDRSLIGQDVVILVNTYVARMEVYVDGKNVYRRPDNVNVERYFATQAVPVRFTVTQPHHVFAMRVDTPLMTGIYQLPFELHKYDRHDRSLVGYQFYGGELRMIAAYVVMFFGCFFLLVYLKTRHSMYLVAAAYGILVFPFFGAINDYFFGLFSPEFLLYMHYTGLCAVFLLYVFSQYFHKFTPRLNKVAGGIIVAMGLTLASNIVHPDLALFQHVRGLFFVVIALSVAGGLYMLARGIQARRPGALVLFIGTAIFLASAVHDILLALGAITSSAMIFVGVLVSTGAMLYVAANTFANTFLENKKLVKDLQGMNDNLEGLVAERTLQLRQKTIDIEAMLQNMPEGVLTVQGDNSIHPEYSAYLETILETSHIAGKNLMALVFSNTNLGADVLSQVEAAAGACIGEDKMNFEFNAHLMVRELDKTMPDGRVKSLELGWSPICDEHDTIEKLMLCVRDVTELKRLASEAQQQRRELEIIGQILAVNQEKFHEFVQSAGAFLAENRKLLAATRHKDLGVIGLLFRNMHTLKGNARTHGLLHLTNAVHEAEQAYDALRKNADAPWDPAALLAQLETVQVLVDEIDRINTHTLGRKGPGRRGGVEKFLLVEKAQVAQSVQLLREVDTTNEHAMREALAQVGKTLSLIGTEPIRDTLGGIIDSLPSLARELGKEAPQVVIDDDGIVVRTQVSGLLRNLFTHVLRNSVDHGLEDAATRVARGKPGAGRIDVNLSMGSGQLRIRLRDDGRGLPMAKIRRTAIDKGLMREHDVRSPEALAQMIFTSGFSTADTVTEVSGRGVGMDAVKGFVLREGGDIEIRFLDDAAGADFRPFELLITLPEKYAVQPSRWTRLHDMPQFLHTMAGLGLAH